MIQQGVSVGGAADPTFASTGSMIEGAGNEMTIGKVMDWIEARLEAIKSREEEEDEDEEKEKERARGGTNATSSASTSKPIAAAKPGNSDSVATSARHKDNVCNHTLYPLGFPAERLLA